MAATNRRTRKRSRSSAKGTSLLRAFVENPRQVASILPSSSTFQQKLAELESLRAAEVVVELGPGTGETTRAILSAMPSRAKLLCIEIVPELVEQVRRIQDDRLVVVEGDAADLNRILRRNGVSAADAIVAGIPFSHFTPEQRQDLIHRIHCALRPGGAFVAYQFRDHIRDVAQARFGSPKTLFVPWNIPPLVLYEWKKQALTATKVTEE